MTPKVKAIWEQYVGKGSPDYLENGRGHIVWADGNFEDWAIRSCLAGEYVTKRGYTLADDELVVASLKDLLVIPEAERFLEGRFVEQRSEALQLIIRDAEGVTLPLRPTSVEVPPWLVKRLMERVLALVKATGFVFDGVAVRRYASKPDLRGVLESGTQSVAAILGVFALLGLSDREAMRRLTSAEGINEADYDNILRSLMDG